MPFTPPDKSIFVPPDKPVDSTSVSVEDGPVGRAGAVTEMFSQTKGVTRALLQGAMFGFGDESEAGARALVDRAEDEDFGEAYFRHRDTIRSDIAQFQAEHPALSMGAELVGGFAVPGLGAAGTVARGATLVSRVKRGIAVGTGTGALFGAGTAEELEDIPLDVAKGAGLGAITGAAFPVVGEGVRRGVGAIRAAVSPESGATRRVGLAMSRDEMTPEQLSNALDEAKALGRPATVADVGGESIRRELEVAAMSPGQAAQLVERQLAGRNKEQLNRLSNDLLRGTGVSSNSVEQAISNTMKIRAEAARPLYQRAMDFSAEHSDDIIKAYKNTIKTPLGRQALGKAGKILNIDKFNKAPLMERIDAVKKGMDDIIGSAVRKGEREIAASALKAKNHLLELVDQANPAYKEARQIWENSSNYLESIDRGRDVLKSSFTAAKLSREFSELTDAEKEGFRIGVVDAVITKLRQQSAEEPNLVRLLRSSEIRDKIKAVMLPEQAARFDRILDVEDAMFRTASQTRKGSATAQRVEAMAEQKKMVGLVALSEELTALVITPLRSAVVKGIPSLARGTRERLVAKQNAAIAKRLLSSDVDELLSTPVLQPRHPEGAFIAPAIAGIEGSQEVEQ